MSRRTIPLGFRARPFPASPSLAFEEPVSRTVTSINVRKEDKDVFLALQSWFSFVKGRPLAQWDAFSLLIDLAYGNAPDEMPPCRRNG